MGGWVGGYMGGAGGGAWGWPGGRSECAESSAQQDCRPQRLAAKRLPGRSTPPQGPRQAPRQCRHKRCSRPPPSCTACPPELQGWSGRCQWPNPVFSEGRGALRQLALSRPASPGRQQCTTATVQPLQAWTDTTSSLHLQVDGRHHFARAAGMEDPRGNSRHIVARIALACGEGRTRRASRQQVSNGQTRWASPAFHASQNSLGRRLKLVTHNSVDSSHR